MEKIVICECLEKPEEKPMVNTDGPLVQAIIKYGNQMGFDISKRDGNAIWSGGTWYVAYYESDLEKDDAVENKLDTPSK